MAYYNIGEHFNWFMGRVVELDPTEDPKFKRYLGRVKIRVIHDQTGDLGKIKAPYGIPDSDLLWAWPLSSIQSASLSYRKIVELEEYPTPFWIDAVGTSPTGIAVGTYVFGFYIDGAESNIPVIFATYHKDSLYPEPPTDAAAGDMLQIKPPTGPEYDYMDVSALAKGWHHDPDRDENHPLGKEYPPSTEPEKGGQMLPKHKSAANPDGYKKGLMNLVWEPSSDYNTKYPFNFVHTTKSGHAIELDDTQGHERIQWWHRSGSFEELSNNILGGPQDRDGLPGEYPQKMVGWKEPMKNHEPGTHPPWEGRRVKKTTGNDYTIVLENKETYVGGSTKLEIVNNTTSGIGNNQIETVANNVYIAVGFYPRTANNELSGESARYQLKDSWQAETGFRNNADKTFKELPTTHKYDFITDVANNVQTSVGWTWKKAREIDVYSQKNNFVEVANNQLVSLGWIPLNNYDGDKEGRSIQELDKMNHYLDVKNNSFTTIGWNPFEEARQAVSMDIGNHYTDVKNNAWVNIGYEPKGDDARLINSDDVFNYYTDVRNTWRQTTQNNLYISVGNLPKDERKKSESDERSLFIDVSNKWATRVGTDTAFDFRGKMNMNIIKEGMIDAHAQFVINGHQEVIIKSPVGITFEAPSVTVVGGGFSAEKGLSAMSKGMSTSFTAMNGVTLNFTDGILTSIERP